MAHHCLKLTLSHWLRFVRAGSFQDIVPQAWPISQENHIEPTFLARVGQTITAFLPWLQGRGGDGAPARVQAKHVIGPCFRIGVQV